MKSNKIMFNFLIVFILFFFSCKQEIKKETMTVTTNSKKALEFYQKGYETAYHIVELDKAVSYYKQAIKEDSNFFMAYYQLASYYLFHDNIKEFEENAYSGINCDIKLSKGEEIQKKALEKWLQNRNSNNSDLGLQLIALYPDDPDAFLNLGFYYYMNNEYGGAISAFEKAATMQDDDNLYCGPKLAIVPYCMLGYTYLRIGQLDNAKNNFDKYIDLFPHEQNPHDSKGDYFMKTKEYDKAYESYMTAYKIDTTFQEYYNRAMEAKHLYDSLQTK